MNKPKKFNPEKKSKISNRASIIIYIIGGLLIVNLVVLGYFFVLVDAPEQGLLRVIFLDIGQGDAILIQTPDKQNILVDGGPDKGIIYKLDKYISITDRSIDLMIATHADMDHITGLAEVLRRFPVKQVLDNGLSGESPAYYEWHNSIQRENISKSTVDAPQTILLEDDLSFQFLWPDQDLVEESSADSNFASVVVKLIYNNISFLLTGDATIETEEILIQNDNDLAADVLKAGHHGSKYSSSIEFLQKIKPEYGVISAGKDNKFGHPTLRVLKNLSTVGAQILRTDKIGDIIFTTNGEKLNIKTQIWKEH